MTRILDEMEEMKRGLDAVMLDHLGASDTESGSVQSRIALYAERNGELHVLCRTLLDKYREVAPNDPFVYEADSILCNVPQCRLPADAPLRRGY